MGYLKQCPICKGYLADQSGGVCIICDLDIEDQACTMLSELKSALDQIHAGLVVCKQALNETPKFNSKHADQLGSEWDEKIGEAEEILKALDDIIEIPDLGI